ncbi:hypothetical protein R1sor_025176 [Riccia sorocarpa]|uniref:Fungal lipase-type domain-containing protein n=1 Tax=Riccia sorocarpa TaxID=122646 RepID=A0ABD3G7U7_9MARC
MSGHEAMSGHKAPKANIASRWRELQGANNWEGLLSPLDLDLRREILSVDPEEIKRLGRRNIIVAWRGTTTEVEWQEDSLTSQIQPTSVNGTPVPDNIRVWRGFWEAFADFHPRKSVFGIKGSAGKQATQEVKRLVEKYADEEMSITCLGHSLGGALATYCAYQIAEDEFNITPSGTTIPVTAFVFGSPRVGNIAFRERFETLGVKVLRIVVKQDIVNCFPIGEEEDGNSLTDLVKAAVEQALEKNAISDPLGFYIGRLNEATLSDEYIHVGVALSLDITKSPYLKPPGKVDLDSMEYLYKPHYLIAYLHLVNGIFGGADDDDLNKPFKPVVIRDLAPLNKDYDLLEEPYAKHVPAKWWVPQRNHGLELNKEGFWVFPNVHGNLRKPNPDFD